MKRKAVSGVMLTLLLISMLTMAVSTQLIKQAEASASSPITVNVLWLIDASITDFPLTANHFIALDPNVLPLSQILDPVNFPGVVQVQFNFTANGQQNYAVALGDPAEGALGITPSLLYGADIVIISTQRIAVRGWDPQIGGGGGLTQTEKDALLDFVNNRGVLWVFGEAGIITHGLQFFNPPLNNDIAQNSIANLFGVNYSGNFAGSSYELTVPPGVHPIINGPFGNVTTIFGGGAGNIVELGPGVDCVIANSIGCYLAVGSGGLLFTTDTEPFRDNRNTVFINNVFAFLASILEKQTPREVPGWLNVGYDLNNTNYYPWPSETPVALENLTVSWTSPNKGAIWMDVVGKGAILTGDITDDGYLEIVSAFEERLFVTDKDGNLLWERNVTVDSGISGAKITPFGSIDLSDVDGDGSPEVVVGVTPAVRYPGVNKPLRILFYDGNGDLLKIISPPDSHVLDVKVADLDNDGDKEVIAAIFAWYTLKPRGIYVYDYNNGSELWHYNVGPIVWITAISDINNDGNLEILLGSFAPHNGNSDSGTDDFHSYVFAFDKDGNNLWTTQIGTDDVRSAVSDLDNDGIMEIISFRKQSALYYPGPNDIYILNADGSFRYNYSGPTNLVGGWQWGIADINNDGNREIIASHSGITEIIVLNHNLTVLKQASIGLGMAVEAINDINGDRRKEVIVSMPDKKLMVLDNTLTEVWNYTLGEKGRAIVSDLDNDGVNEIVASADKLYVFSVVLLPQDFSITASPTSLTIGQGSSDTSLITITSIGGFNQPVQLSVSGAPSGVTATLNPEQVTPPPDGSTTSTLTVSVDTTATPGNYTLTVTGTNGTIIHSVDIQLEITTAPPPPNQPPDPPNFLLQYELDGPEIPVGLAIWTDAVTLLGVVSDPDGDRVKLQIELRRLDEYAGSFIGTPTHESEFVESDYGVMINITGLIPGSYHWQARTVDEAGATSDWVDFGNNDISETDFAVTTEIVFRPPYRLSSKSGWSESHLLGQASNYSEVDPSVGYGKIMADATVTFGGYGEALAAFTLGDYWRNDWSGTATIAATFNITGLITWTRFSFPKYFTQVYLGVNLKASLWVYDHSSSMEIWRKDLIIYNEGPEWKVISLPEGDAVSYSDTQYVIQGFVDLEKDHTYSWYFEAQIWSRVDVSGFATAVAGGNFVKYGNIELIDVRIAPPVLRPEPEPIVTGENVMYVAVGSPADVLVVDPEGRRIGFDFTSQQEVNEIPEAWYSGRGTFPQLIIIPTPIPGNYEVLMFGTGTDSYTAVVFTHFTTQETVSFMASDIPTSPSATHQYTIDWDALSLGEEGVNVQIDSDGDGIFEHTFTSDGELTQSEYVATINAINTWITDSDFNEIDDFRAVFTPYGNTTLYKLTATNPGQFYFNILVNNTWPEPQNLTVVYSIDADFTLKGANPIHVYADLGRTVDITANCTFTDNTITVYNVAPNAIIYVTIHLNYAPKGTTWTAEEVEAWYSEHSFSATVRSITSKVVITDPELKIPPIPLSLIFLAEVLPALIICLGILASLLKRAMLSTKRRK